MTLNMLPMFNSLTVGFDSILNELSNLPTSTFPPYNIEKTGEGKYKITFAVAGFNKNDIEITCKENTLKVSGKTNISKEAEYLYKGIAERAFNQSFKLADFTNVIDAEIKDGMLHVNLEQNLPEEKKEKKVNIK
ncbi:MAG: Hsp20 family protein [Minisyncoccia bacterium]